MSKQQSNLKKLKKMLATLHAMTGYYEKLGGEELAQHQHRMHEIEALIASWEADDTLGNNLYKDETAFKSVDDYADIERRHDENEDDADQSTETS